MATKKKMLQAAAGNATGGAALNVEDVFSTYLYEGNLSSNTISNGIDLDGEGGMVWIKNRDSSSAWPSIGDTERGVGEILFTNTTSASQNAPASFTSFNSNGFTIGANYEVNTSSNSHASWTFRKAPKFFDVVTWTGDGVAGRTVSHNLGTTVGTIIIKDLTDSSWDWQVYHRSVSGYGALNATDAWSSYTGLWNSQTPTDTEFYLGSDVTVNSNGDNYVAYLFAHNDGDGEFGPDADADIIKCGSYTGNGSTDGPEIDLGFEPQWVMIKCSSVGGPDWQITDSMRGIATGGNESVLFPNLSSAENSTTEQMSLTPRGFKITGTASQVNTNSATYIYIAIRRGTKVPESATEVFAIDSLGGTPPNPPAFYSGWPVDMSMFRRRSQTANWAVSDRLRGPTAELRTNSTEAEQFISDQGYDQMTGYADSSSVVSDMVSWMWKRAPNFFDVVAYTGTGSARTVSHNLGVAPEMMWVKRRDSTGGEWQVYHTGLNGGTNPEQYAIELNSEGAEADQPRWNDTAPTDSVFSLGDSYRENSNGDNYIAYLFASLPGISKVGSYTGNGSTLNIDCGFSSGARFVMVKPTSESGNWTVVDTERGIIAGNDPLLFLNTTDAEDTTFDSFDPNSSGFTLTDDSPYANSNGATYIFYAIA